MINAQELKARITSDDVRKLLLSMGATIFTDNEEVIITDTICHGGSKPKLYYYHESKQFHCYTNCGSFDIIELVIKNREYTFTEAIRWICIKLDYSTNQEGFGEFAERINDWDFINNIRKRKDKKNKTQKIDFYNRNILNIFQKMYLRDWLDEGIGIESLLRYSISYSSLQQKIIIPHFNIDHQLMGIRTRTTNEEEEELYGKYTPFQLGGVMYSHPIGQNLYGIHINKETIKRKKKIMLVEGEKSVFQTDTMFGEDNFTVALCGSNLTEVQKDLIVSLGVNEVIIALDKQYEDAMSEEADKWAKHIREKIINKLAPYCVVTILWDTENLLPHKASPTDLGKDVLLKLMDNKIYAGCVENPKNKERG